MKKVKSLIILLALAFLVFNGACERKITVYSIGDSTMSNYNEARTLRRGWGQMLPQFFDNRLRFENVAVAGRSSKSFIAEKRWEKVIADMRPGDYVIIQFGHNDSIKKDTTRYTEPWSSYSENLKKFVTETRDKGGNPILAPSIVRHIFNGDTLDHALGEYPEAVRTVAAELAVPLVDLNKKTRNLVNGLGQKESKKLFFYIEKGFSPLHPDGAADDTHLCEYGATEIAQLFVEGLREIDHPLADYVK